MLDIFKIARKREAILRKEYGFNQNEVFRFWFGCWSFLISCIGISILVVVLFVLVFLFLSINWWIHPWIYTLVREVDLFQALGCKAWKPVATSTDSNWSLQSASTSPDEIWLKFFLSTRLCAIEFFCYKKSLCLQNFGFNKQTFNFKFLFSISTYWIPKTMIIKKINRKFLTFKKWMIWRKKIFMPKFQWIGVFPVDRAKSDDFTVIWI